MNKIINCLFLSVVCLCVSCSSLVEDINIDPNGINANDIEASSFLTGTLLANSMLHCSHAMRITGLWSGQLVGYTSLYSNIYAYNISTSEMNDPWNLIYIGILPNVRHIREAAPNDDLLQGISKTVEALAISTGASLFGDIPYNEANEGVENPIFDPQLVVLNNALLLLDEAIVDLENADSRNLEEDIYFGGNAAKWKASAYTIKARIYMWIKNYPKAYESAIEGIASFNDNMQHIPRGSESVTSGDKNLFFQLTFGPRAGEIGTRESYLLDLLNPNSPQYRGNDKTNEEARFAYYQFNETTGNDNLGFAHQFEPQDIVSFQENQLILAETAVRNMGMEVGLEHLNEYRSFFNEGGNINSNFDSLPSMYLPYRLGDFEAGGIENSNGISTERALLREIIEERYVTGFGTFMPFDDARRLRKNDADLSVSFPLNNSSTVAYPERLPYAEKELNTNNNAPANSPSIFEKTAVND